MSKAQIVRRSLTMAGAALLTIQLHEYAHGVVGWLLTGGAEVRSNSAGAIAEMTATEAGIQALAGPLFSLVSGLAIFLISQRVVPGFARTVLLWWGLASMMNFFGYLMTAIAGGPGDVVAAVTYFELPAGIVFPLFVIGSAGTLSLSYLLCREIRRSAETPHQMRALGIFPWLIATGIMVLIGLVINLTSDQNLTGAELFLVLLASFAALIFAPMFTFFIKRVPYGGSSIPPLGAVAPSVFFAITLALQLFHAYVGVRLGS